MKLKTSTFLVLILLLLAACSGSHNETTIFQDLPVYDPSQENADKNSNQTENPKLLATVLKLTFMIDNPEDTTSNKSLNPGEKVKVLGDSIFIGEAQTPYLKVENQYQETGWVASHDLIQDTKLGVTIKSTPLFNKPDIFSNRDEQAEFGDILVVRKNQKNGWYAVTKNDDILEYWINDLSFISFQEEDIHLALIRKNVLKKLPEQTALYQLRSAIDCTYFTKSVFYKDLVDSLYKYQPDTLIVE